jgi:hypothetical protein
MDAACGLPLKGNELEKMLNAFIHRLEKITDRTFSPDEIEKYVVDRYMFLSYQYMHGRDAEDEEALRDLHHLHERIIELGWIKAPQNPFKVIKKSSDISMAEIIQWRQSLKDDRVISSGVVKVGTGFYLDQLGMLEGEEHSDFYRQNLERLLRHVETHRGRSLRRFDRRLKEEKRWREKLDIVLLFIRTSRRLRDLRFLNAALKCTDDYYSYFKFKLPGPLLIRYLMALAEKEISFRDLVEK